MYIYIYIYIYEVASQPRLALFGGSTLSASTG